MNLQVTLFVVFCFAISAIKVFQITTLLMKLLLPGKGPNLVILIFVYQLIHHCKGAAALVDIAFFSHELQTVNDFLVGSFGPNLAFVL